MEQTMLAKAVRRLLTRFQKTPHAYFHERELHAEFFGMVRSESGTCSTSDGKKIHLLRYEYESLNRYSGRAYDQPAAEGGTTAAFDFALLRKDFVKCNDLLTVINKHEPRRRSIRDKWSYEQASPAVEAAVEFKMAHRVLGPIGDGRINQLANGMLQDCRKLRCERVAHAVVIGMSHGPLPTCEAAKTIICDCKKVWGKPYWKGQLVVWIVTPEHLLSSDDL